LVKGKKVSPRIKAILVAFLVTFLWATSWVMIRLGLKDIPPLIFAGLRYMIASIILIPFSIRTILSRRVKVITGTQWFKLITLGLTFYFIAQGAQYIGLQRLPTMVVSMLLNIISIVVAFMGLMLLSEQPTVLQWIGVLLNFVGLNMFFLPYSFSNYQVIGIIIVLIGMLGASTGMIIGRDLNRKHDLPPVFITCISMLVGSSCLLITGLIVEGLPKISLVNLLYILWMAGINTALGFTLWNFALRELKAVESSVVSSTINIFIALLAWIFLGETLMLNEIFGMLIAGVGIILVQIRAI
jgi:drug/metabolite transporter (DMT)-like permease